MEDFWRSKWKLFLVCQNSSVHLKETEVTISLLSEAFSILSENCTRHKSSRFVSQSMAIGFVKSDINWNGVWLGVDFQLCELSPGKKIICFWKKKGTKSSRVVRSRVRRGTYVNYDVRLFSFSSVHTSLLFLFCSTRCTPETQHNPTEQTYLSNQSQFSGKL